MDKNKIMLFSERLLFAEALAEYRKQEMYKIGIINTNEERLKKYYMDCIGLLVGLELLDIKKSKQFITELIGDKNNG